MSTAHIPKCEICGYKAPRTKLGMKVNGRFVLMKVKPSRPPEMLQTLRLYDVTNDCWHDDIPILDPTEEDLEVRIRSTVVSTLGHTVHRPWSVAAPPKQWPNFDDDLQAADGAGGEREGSEDEFSDGVMRDHLEIEDASGNILIFDEEDLAENPNHHHYGQGPR